jgi:hypothetical protein
MADHAHRLPASDRDIRDHHLSCHWPALLEDGLNNPQGTDPTNYKETNGRYAIGAADLNAGTKVWEVNPPGRTLVFTVTTSYLGYEAGTLQFSNGNYMAATNDFSGVTIKSSASSNGTIWAFKVFDGSVWWINRYVSQHSLVIDYLAGFNNLHQQLSFCVETAHGCYIRWNPIP